MFGGGAAVGVLPGKFDFLPTKEQEGLVKKRGDQLLVAASPIDQVPENKIGALLVILVCRFWGLYIYIFFGLDQFIMCRAKLAWKSLS